MPFLATNQVNDSSNMYITAPDEQLRLLVATCLCDLFLYPLERNFRNPVLLFQPLNVFGSKYDVGGLLVVRSELQNLLVVVEDARFIARAHFVPRI